MSGRFDRFDLCPGGTYRMVLSFDNPAGSLGKTTATTDVIEANVLAVIPGVRVVQAVDFVTDDPRFAGTMTMTWKATMVEGGTRVDIIAENVTDAITADDHVARLDSSLQSLADYLRET